MLREKVAAAVSADPVFSKKGKYFLERSELVRPCVQVLHTSSSVPAEVVPPLKRSWCLVVYLTNGWYI